MTHKDLVRMLCFGHEDEGESQRIGKFGMNTQPFLIPSSPSALSPFSLFFTSISFLTRNTRCGF